MGGYLLLFSLPDAFISGHAIVAVWSLEAIPNAEYAAARGTGNVGRGLAILPLLRTALHEKATAETKDDRARRNFPSSNRASRGVILTSRLVFVRFRGS